MSAMKHFTISFKQNQESWTLNAVREICVTVAHSLHFKWASLEFVWVCVNVYERERERTVCYL